MVYYEIYDRLEAAIHREKQLKKWRREWKEKLINDFNPGWKDLAEDIGVDSEYIQAVKDTYASGLYVPGAPKEIAGQARDEARAATREIAGQARDEARAATREIAGQARDEGEDDEGS